MISRLTPLGGIQPRTQQPLTDDHNATRTLAARILLSGAKRRSEFADPLPTDEKARAVILCGMRRRDEAIAEVDEIWLNGYLARTDRAR